MLVLEKELSDINFLRLKKVLIYIKIIYSDNDMHLTVDALIDIKNMVPGSTNITPRNVNVKPRGCDKMHMDKDLIKDKLYELIDQFNEREINGRDFYSVLLDNTQPFYDGNKRTCKIIC